MPPLNFKSAKTDVLIAMYGALVAEDGALYLDGEQVHATIEGYSLSYLYKVLDSLVGDDLLSYNSGDYSITEAGILFVENSPQRSGVKIPASDRIVTLSDNHRDAIEEGANEIIASLELENSIDGDASLKDRLLGEIKAGRELIRVKSFRAYLLYLTVVEAVEALIKRYGPTALGEAAKKFLDLLIEHIFGK